ncbi:DUF599 domain-containing protein [Gayadomonas joobiniege]|uniref:DUF599 domain-containing protein n=1 Tax=Gayadomonas joobiniege TaxID=1234606 RepID=UPI000373B4DF|nr:DUF599 domain-containing protein [Gayadomonas joobiniege]
MFAPNIWIEFLSLLLFVIIWVSYAVFARRAAKHRQSLSSVMVIYRIDWMKHLLQRENRILDASLMGNIEKSISFFASTTLFVIAGALTALTSARSIYEIIQLVPWVWPQTMDIIQLKVVTIIVILIYAFFKFTWALRQFSFASVMIGAAPNHNDTRATEEMKRVFAVNAGKLIDQAGHNLNAGMRSYYFALAVVGWFIHPLLFIAVTLIVVAILYRREFKSRSLRSLADGLEMSQYYLDNQELKFNKYGRK